MWDRAVEFVSPTLEEIGRFFSSIWNWISDKFGIAVDFFTKPNKDGKTGFSEWIAQVFVKIQSVWNRAVEFLSPVFQEIGKFFSSIWDWISDKFGIAIDFFKKPNKDGKTGFSEWIAQVFVKIQSVWDRAVEFCRPVFEEIGKFLSNTWSWIMSLINPGSGGAESVEDASEGSSIEKASGAIEEFSSEIGGVSDVANTLQSKLGPIGEFLQSVFTSIGDLINKISGFFSEHKETFSEDLTSLLTGLGTFVGGVMSALGDLLSIIGKYLKGDLSFTESEIGTLTRLLSVGVIPLIAKIGEIGFGLLAKGLGINLVSIGGELAGIGTGIALIFGSVIALKGFNITDDDMLYYGKWVLIAAAVIGAIIIAINKLSNAGGGGGGGFNGTAVAKKALGVVERIGMLAVVLGMLPEVIRAIGEAKEAAGGAPIGEDILMTIVSSIVGMTLATVALMGVSALAGAAGTAGLTGMLYAGAYIAAAVGVIAGVLALVNAGFEDAGGYQQLVEKATLLRQAIDAVAGAVGDMLEEGGKSLGGAVGGFIGAVIGGTAGAAIEEFGKGLSAYNKLVKGQDLTESEKLAIQIQKENQQLDKMISGMTGLAESMSGEDISNLRDILVELNKIQGFEGSANFDSFSRGFNSIVTAFSTLIGTINSNSDSLSMYSDPNIRERFAEALEDIKTLFTFFDFLGGSGFETLANSKQFVSFLDSLDTFVTGNAMVTNEGNSVTYLGRFISNVIQIYDYLYGFIDQTDQLAKFEAHREGVGKVVDLIKELGVVLDVVPKVKEMESEIFDYGDKYAVGRIEANMDMFLGDIEAIYDKFDEYKGITQRSDNGILGMAQTITDLFSLFGTGGAGSDVWKGNYSSFIDMVNNGDFVDNYVKAVQKIYEAFGNDTLGPESGIVFDGSEIVTKLFEAIDVAMKGLDDVPTIDASPVIDAIVAALGLGETAIAKAVHDMVQAGIAQTTFDISELGEPSEGLGLSDDAMALFQSWADPENMKNLLKQYVNLDGISTTLSQIISESGLFGDQNGLFAQLGAELEKASSQLPDLTTILGEKGILSVDENGEATNLIETLTDSLTKAGEALGTSEPIQVKIQPVFTLDQLTKENLQQQLDNLDLVAPASLGSLPDVGVDFSNLKSALEIEAIKQQLAAINESIALYGKDISGNVVSLGSHMDGVGAAIGSVRVVIDTGALVGYILPKIDMGLGDRAYRYGRTGTAPNGATYVATNNP